MEKEQNIEVQNKSLGVSLKTGKIIKNTILSAGLIGAFSGYYIENKKIENSYNSSTCEHKNNEITKEEIIDDFKKNSEIIFTTNNLDNVKYFNLRYSGVNVYISSSSDKLGNPILSLYKDSKNIMTIKQYKM